MIPAQLDVLGITLHIYGFIIGLGILAGTGLVVRARRIAHTRGERLGISEEQIWQGLWWVIGGGILGARLYHVVDYWLYYKEHVGQIVAVWNGGLGIYGGLLGAGLAILMYAKYARVSWREALDLGVMGLPVGQAIGRWGNFVNQELYGKPSYLPWSIYIGEENRLPGYEQISRYHPLFLYESLGMLVLALSLWGLFLRKRIPVGRVVYAGLYLAGYGLVRFSLEPFRLESWEWGGVAVAQLVSLGAVALGLGLWYTHRGKDT
jgi:phosphatidylglycerol---prolipoprotein diacylglyceryl transferase